MIRGKYQSKHVWPSGLLLPTYVPAYQPK